MLPSPDPTMYCSFPQCSYLWLVLFTNNDSIHLLYLIPIPLVYNV